MNENTSKTRYRDKIVGRTDSFPNAICLVNKFKKTIKRPELLRKVKTIFSTSRKNSIVCTLADYRALVDVY